MSSDPIIVEPLDPTPDDVKAWDNYWQSRPPHGVRVTVAGVSVELDRHQVARLMLTLHREHTA